MAALQHKSDILNDNIINSLSGLPHIIESITVRVKVGERIIAIRYTEGVGSRWAANPDDVWSIRKAIDAGRDKGERLYHAANSTPDYDALDIDRDEVAFDEGAEVEHAARELGEG